MNTLKKLLTYKEIILIIFLLLVSGLAHGYNMFHFPYFENDEGSYSSYAWALMEKGELSPYTYWYDHAPAGWMQIGLWTFLTGGFFTFGYSLNSGRVLMLVFHLLSSFLLYIVAKKLTGSRLAGAISVLVFSLTPLGIYYQRRVLLDNIMNFWILSSVFFLLHYKNKLRHIILSAAAFGIAFLTKETAVFFTPILLYMVYVQAHIKHKLFAIVKWMSIAGIVVSFYFLYAFLKGELFPTGTLLGGKEEHVSLLGTLLWQAGREGGGILDIETSSFWNNMRIWINEDPVLIFAGAIATVTNLVIGIKLKSARIASLLAVSMWAYLMRGGIVLELYILTLIPFIALNIGILSSYIQKIILNTNSSFHRTLSNGLLISIMLFFASSSFYYADNVRGSFNLYLDDQTTPQVQAVNWILSQNNPEAFYVIDNYALIDLWEKNANNYKRADWYWKVDKDTEISEDVLGGRPEDIDYIALTPQMDHDISAAGLEITGTALANAQPVTSFWNDGWGVEIWATRYAPRILQSSWESYKKNFIQGGRVSDPAINNSTTSEGQSYALLRAVYMNDSTSFASIYSWTKRYLQQGSGIFFWKWEGTNSKGRVIDQSNATDADQDIALALLFAYKKWGNKNYLQEAQRIMDGIWDNNVAESQGRYYLLPGNWGNHGEKLTLNPSYFSPAHYRIFADADPSHPWSELVDSSYIVLEKCTVDPLDKEIGVLPPEWCSFDSKLLIASQPEEPQPTATEYSYNAFRTPWRIALDYTWYQDPRAKDYLSKLSFLEKEWNSNNKLVAAYTHDGQVWEDYESVAAYGANIAYFKIMHPDQARVIYETKILKKFYEDREQSYWDDPKNYYTQNWAWFGTALVNDHLQNLWNTKGNPKTKLPSMFTF